MRRRVLVLTRDLIPLPGRSTAGGGIRAHGLGEALKLKGHEVVYSVPRKLVPEGEQFDELREFSFEVNDLQTTILKSEADVLLLEQWGLATHLDETSLPVVLDLHGSLILENAFRQHRSFTSNAAAKIKSLRKADLVICPGYRQRSYFMAWMLMSGFEPKDLPVEVVPVSMTPEMPERAADYEGPLSLIYGGQLWPWIEPGVALNAATDVLEETGEGNLHLFVNEPAIQDVLPYDDSTRVPAWHLPDHVCNSDAVKLEGMIPHDEMVSRYSAAHLAVDVYAWNPERELAFTTRTVEYLWAGLPVVYGNYGELARLIEDYEAGWVVDPADPEAVKGAIQQAVTNREELARRSENAQRLVRERLSWDNTIDTLDRFVQDPLVRPKGDTIFGKLALEFERLKSEALDRMSPLEENLKHFKAEVAARDRRIVSLTDETARLERNLDEARAEQQRKADQLVGEKEQLEKLLKESQLQLDAQSVEVNCRERELRESKAKLEKQDDAIEELTEDVARVKHLLDSEQGDHAQTVERSEQVRQDFMAARDRLEHAEEELDQVKVDLKSAISKIADQESEFDECRENLEDEVRTYKHNELELRQELAAAAAAADELQGQLSGGDEAVGRLKEQIEALNGRLHDLRNSWLERTVATGQHSLRRAAFQVPAVAGLWVRNLANNAYMTVWQKRHNVKIFPGQ